MILDCQKIEEESNFSQNGENMKYDEENSHSVEKTFDEAIKLRKKKCFQ